MNRLGDTTLEILEAMPDGMLVSDERGRIVFVTRRFAAMSGYEPAELVGQPLEVVVPERLRPAHVEHRHGYVAGGVHARPMGAGLEIALRRADASEVPVDISLSPAEIGGHRFVIAAVRDITERKRVEAAVQESERRWDELLANVQLAVIGFDRRRRVDYANPYLLALTGYREDELLGSDWVEDHVPEHQRDAVRSTVQALLDGAQPRYLEHEIVTRTGRRRTLAWFNTRVRGTDGGGARVLSVGADVTERHRAEARDRAANRVGRAILGGTTGAELLHHVVASASRLLGAEIGVLMSRAGDELHVDAAVGGGTEALAGRSFRAGESPAWEVLGRGSAVVDGAVPAWGLGGRAQSLVAVPLWFQGEAFGVLVVGTEPGGRRLDDDDVAELEAFAEQAAVALEYGRSQDELRRLTLLEDRERVARELHDTVIQEMFAVGMRLQMQLRRDALGTPEGAQVVEECVWALDRVIEGIRDQIFHLESGDAPEDGLRRKLDEVVAEAAAVLGFAPHLAVDGDLGELPAGLEEDVVAVVRESLSNVARHARASAVDVRVCVDGGRLELVVEDDGVGLPSGGPAPGSLGLRNLATRAERAGGALELSPAPSGGARVRWVVPLARAFTGPSAPLP